MSTFLRIILAATAILMAVIGLAHAQNSPVYVVTYVDVMPNATNSGAALLQHYGDASGNEKGNLRTIVLQEMARPNRFAIIEMWKDKAASDAHDKASSSAELIEKLKAIDNAPFDRRLSNGLYVDSQNSEKQRDAIYVLTHVDVVSRSKDDCMTLLKSMSVDSRRILATSATAFCSRPTGPTTLRSSRSGRTGKRWIPTLQWRTPAFFGKKSRRWPARFMMSAFTKHSIDRLTPTRGRGDRMTSFHCGA
jgi:quinol monooxygenase YgiN